MTRPSQKPGDPFLKLPQPKNEWDAPWAAYEIVCPANILLLSDIHIPYHDNDALRVALEAGRAANIDMVLLNGDTADFFSVSAWEKDPRLRDLPAEINAVKELMGVLRELFPAARLIWKNGNHEDRWERYLFVKAPVLVGIPDFEMDKVLDLASFNCEFVKDMRPITAGKLWIIHGHEYRFAMSNPVNPARGFFLKAKTHVIGGHLHQSSQHSETTLEGLVLSTWSTGCLSQLHPRYMPLNRWNHGFALVTVSESGSFDVQIKRIIGNKAW